MCYSNRNVGYSLIELLATLAILGLLITLLLPVAETLRQRVREQELRLALREIRTAIDAYKRAYDEGRIVAKVGSSGYPPNLEVLVQGVEDARDPRKSTIYFLRRIPRDPFSAELSQSDADTWGKRSYASSADDPKEGEDIYDIFSRSRLTGLNGIEHAKW
jgi:general secretion pathway protein G